MLLGREGEFDLLQRLVSEAKRGCGGTLAVAGPAGIGKSALLDWIAESGEVQVVRAQGAPAEKTIPFAGLAQVVTPLLDFLPTIPPRQVAALAASLALGPPVGGEAFPVYMGTLGLLTEAARHQTMVVLVDDCHWFDEESLGALQFVQRRLANDPILMVMAFRTGSVFEPPFDLPRLELTGLSVEAASQLMQRLGYTVSPEVVTWLVEATGGNPLALRDLPAYMTSDDLALQAWRNEPAPLGEVLQTAYGHALASMTTAQQQATLIAAVLGRADMRIVARALATAGLGLHDLEAAEDAQLIVFGDGAVHPRHPLIRSAVTLSAAPSARRAAHSAAAAGLLVSEIPQQRDSRVWHLAEATLGPDEPTAALLEKAAASAASRAGLAAARITYERAAELSLHERDRARRLLHAADAAFTGGHSSACNLLLQRAQHSVADSPELAEALEHLSGRVDTWSGSPAAAAQQLQRQAQRCRSTDPLLAIRLAVDATAAAALSGQMVMASENAELVTSLAEQTGSAARPMGDLLVGSVKAMRGDGNDALELLDRARSALDVPEPPAQLLQPLSYLATSYQFIDHFSAAMSVFEPTIAAARRHGAVGELPFALAHLASAEFRVGSWPAAYAHATESLAIAEESGRSADRPIALTMLALIEAGRGEERARGHAAEAISLGEALGAQFSVAQGYSMIGLLDLGIGQPRAAISSLRRCQDMAVELGLMELGYLQWAAELVEALVRCGLPTETAQTLTIMRNATHSGSTSINHALLSRCEGLVADDRTWEEAFRKALSHHLEGELRPFELARTQLCYGERLRRHRRRKDSKPT